MSPKFRPSFRMRSDQLVKLGGRQLVTKPSEGFAAVSDPSSRVLLLGYLPGAVSLWAPQNPVRVYVPLLEFNHLRLIFSNYTEGVSQGAIDKLSARIAIPRIVACLKEVLAAGVGIRRVPVQQVLNSDGQPQPINTGIGA